MSRFVIAVGVVAGLAFAVPAIAEATPTTVIIVKDATIALGASTGEKVPASIRTDVNLITEAVMNSTRALVLLNPKHGLLFKSPPEHERR